MTKQLPIIPPHGMASTIQEDPDFPGFSKPVRFGDIVALTKADKREALRELQPKNMARARAILAEKATGRFSESIARMDEEEAAEDARMGACGIFSLKRHTKDDPSTLIGDRWLCRGGGALLVAPTGVGKSVFTTQLAISFALGRPTLGLAPRKPLSVLVIQAENDAGDVAEARDGVALGLNLTEAERREVNGMVFVRHEDELTGEAFISGVARLAREFHPDLIVADPALSYLGGDASSQADVGAFLRTGLNPILRQNDCAAIIVHHTNKPPREKLAGSFQAGDYAYLGTGSAEWANWARAVLAIKSIGSHDIFELVAGKRGKRLKWTDTEGKPTYSRFIAHAKSREEGGEDIFWREPSPEEVAEVLGTGAASKSKSKHDPAILSEIIMGQGGDPMTYGELEDFASARGIPTGSFKRVLPRAISLRLIAKNDEGRYTLPTKAAGYKVRHPHNDP